MIRKPPGGNHVLRVSNLAELRRFAEIFSKNSASGDFIALTGELGAGKTTFAGFFCSALSVDVPVTSPTFALMNEYQTPQGPILHGDLYRLTDPEIEIMLPEWEEQFETHPGI